MNPSAVVTPTAAIQITAKNFIFCLNSSGVCFALILWLPGRSIEPVLFGIRRLPAATSFLLGLC